MREFSSRFLDNQLEIDCMAGNSQGICENLRMRNAAKSAFRGDPPPLGAAQGIYMSSTVQWDMNANRNSIGISEEEEEADFGEYQEKENVNSGYGEIFNLPAIWVKVNSCTSLCHTTPSKVISVGRLSPSRQP